MPFHSWLVALGFLLYCSSLYLSCRVERTATGWQPLGLEVALLFYK